MARNVALVNILKSFRAEARLSTNPAHNDHAQDQHIDLLRSRYHGLYEKYDWEHLKIRRTYSLQEGLRYYDFTADFDLSRLTRIEVRDGGQWLNLKTPIEAQHYSEYESDLDERAWPVRRWQISEGDQIEIWPIPNQSGVLASRDGYIRVHGIRKLPAFNANSDLCLIDDRLVVLAAAVPTLFAKGEKELGGLAREEFKSLLLTLTGNMTKRKTRQMFGIDDCEDDYRPSYLEPTYYDGQFT